MPYNIIDLRKVRTEAGVRRFHKPIGSEIGGGSKAVKSAVGGALTLKHPTAMKAQARPSKPAPDSVEAIKAQIGHLMTDWASQPEEQKKSDRKAVRTAIRQDRGAPSGSKWADLDDKSLVTVAEHPSLTPAIRREARAELYLRKADQQHLDDMLGAGVKAAKEAPKGSEASAFFKAVTKFSPRTALVLDKISKRLGHKIKHEVEEHKKVAQEEARKTVVRTLFVSGTLLAFSLLTGHPDLASAMEKIRDIPGEFAG